MRSSAASTFNRPTVEWAAMIWRLMLVRHTLSSSTRSMAPTPPRASASTAPPPTPPTPNTATRLAQSAAIPSRPKINSDRENSFRIRTYALPRGVRRAAPYCTAKSGACPRAHFLIPLPGLEAQ